MQISIRNCLWFIAALQVSCASFEETLKDSQRINDDISEAARVPYTGPNPSEVVGGQEVLPSDRSAKMAVLLLISRNAKLSTCTGVLINKRIVLTAAHCVVGAEARNIRILFRTRINERPPGLETFAEKILIHKEFDNKPNSYSDLALLRLQQEAPAEYLPIPLYDAGEKIVDDSVMLVGYGITDERQKDSLILRKTIKSLKNDIHLKKTFIGIEQNSKSGGFCRGDSGAPVIVNSKNGQRVMAINSFTIGLEEKKDCHTASVAMLVPHFSKWIKANASTL